MKVELLLRPGCPNAAAVRAVLAKSLGQLGLAIPVHERVGEFAEYGTAWATLRDPEGNEFDIGAAH